MSVLTYDPLIHFHSLESINQENHIIATYYFSKKAIDHLKLVGFMALESSTGGWLDFPHESKSIREQLSAKVVNYFPIPFTNDKDEEGKAIVQLAFPVQGTVGWTASASMLLTAVAGNILEMPGQIRLLNIDLPKSFLDRLPGPKLGTTGIRKALDIDNGRPLVNMMIKPKVGLSPDVVEDMAYQASLGGIDHIKDDEMMAEVFNCSWEDRLTAVMNGLRRGYEETGNKALYTINITGEHHTLLDRAYRALELGANALMVNYHQGFDSLKMLAEKQDINVPILFHPAGATANKSIGRMVISKLARYFGADIFLTGSPWAKWGSKEELSETVKSGHFLSAITSKEQTFVLQSAQAGLVPAIVGDFGKNVIVGGGGAIHGHPLGIASGVMAIRQAVDATIAGIDLNEYASEHLELKEALKQKPVFERPQEERY